MEVFSIVYRITGFVKLYLIGAYALVSQLFERHKSFDLKKIDGKGRVAIVTGGCDGIGFQVSSGLVRCGFRVIVAGVMIPTLNKTEEGFEEQFGVNFLSHLYLTACLFGKLRESGTADCYSRIVNVSSEAHRPAIIEWQNLNAEQDYSPHMGYMQSKLAVLLSTFALQRRLTAKECYVTANGLHPGVVDTRLYRHLACILKPLFWVISSLLYKNARQGADAVLYTALSTSLEGRGGLYINNCREDKPSLLSHDKAEQEQLWKEAQKLLGDFGEGQEMFSK